MELGEQCKEAEKMRDEGLVLLLATKGWRLNGCGGGWNVRVQHAAARGPLWA
jgi:hypothetical protein